MFNEIVSFISTLKLVDYIFFFAIITLFILILTLIYFIKINDQVFEQELEKKTIKKITKTIEKETKPKSHILDEFEQEQENTAIISCEELLNSDNNNLELNVVEEKEIGDISIKKLDGENTFLPAGSSEYKKEELFLSTLKKYTA